MARLTPEQRAELEKQLADDDAAADEDTEHFYDVWRGDQGARVGTKSPAGQKIKSFFAELGINLDDEPVQDEPPAEPGKSKQAKQAPAAEGGQVRQFGRRIS